MLGKCGVCLRNKNLRFFFFLKMFACYVLSLKKHWKLWVSKLTAIFLLGCICSCHDSFFFYCKCLPYKSLKHILNVKFVFLQVFVFSNTCIAKEESVAFPMCCCSVYAVMINVNVYVFVLARLSFFFKKSIYVYEIHDVNFFFLNNGLNCSFSKKHWYFLKFSTETKMTVPFHTHNCLQLNSIFISLNY